MGAGSRCAACSCCRVLHTRPQQGWGLGRLRTCRMVAICEARRPTTCPLASTSRNRSPSRDCTPCSVKGGRPGLPSETSTAANLAHGDAHSICKV